MERISATRAAREFSDLLNRVCYQGAAFEVERGNKVVARLVPAGPAGRIAVADLNRVFAELPRLGEDAESFAADVEALRRSLPPEGDPWG
jgi:antitoxin (DNA-binding transcriptional repressor) of toxin-antitoxin stability system